MHNFSLLIYIKVFYYNKIISKIMLIENRNQYLNVKIIL
jgi:hypothetical protein